jgi:hypothetical protein
MQNDDKNKPKETGKVASQGTVWSVKTNFEVCSNGILRYSDIHTAIKEAVDRAESVHCKSHIQSLICIHSCVLYVYVVFY